MKNIFSISFFLSLSLGLFAHQLTLIVSSIPENTPVGDTIYIVGNFNGWDPGDPAFMLNENSGGQPEITIEATGTIAFKFTRGSWESVEGNENGGFLPDRNFTMGSADSLEIEILSWEDTGGSNHTAAENVIIMDEEFYMPQFDRHRRIWLYLPPDYETSGKDYPVLYMHDGQNLFDAATSFAGEWEVDETLNSMFEDGKDVPIVAGIDNGGANRIDEYTPWPNAQYGGGDGDLYAQFIVETLKPYIDENYRTKPDRENTGVMGSSLGGLISHYIGIKHQDVFSKSGIFSPSYWFNATIYDFTFETGKQADMRNYMMGGSAESAELVAEMMAMTDTLLAAGFDANEMALKVVPGGQHNEALWRQQFEEGYEWMFLEEASGYNTFDKEPEVAIQIINGRVYLRENKPLDTQYMLKMFSISGQKVFVTKMSSGQSISIPNLKLGIYLINISNDEVFHTTKVFLK